MCPFVPQNDVFIVLSRSGTNQIGTQKGHKPWKGHNFSFWDTILAKKDMALALALAPEEEEDEEEEDREGGDHLDQPEGPLTKRTN